MPTPSSQINEQLPLKSFDAIFLNDVRNVAALVRKINFKQVLPICTNWLNRLRNATPEEKHARNGLMSLLYQQLAEQSILATPFTNERNLYLDLRAVYQNLTSPCSVECEIPFTDSESSVKWSPMSSSETVNDGVCFYLNLEDQNSELVKQNLQLQKEQRVLQFRITQIKVKFRSLTKINEALFAENKMFINEIDNLKKILIRSVLYALKLMSDSQYSKTNSQLFQTLFGAFFEDVKYTKEIKQLDKRFMQVLGKSVETCLELQKGYIVKQSSKDFDKLKSEIDEKYKKALNVQHIAHEKLLTLDEMRYLTVLRKIFVETFKGEEQYMYDVNTVLVKKYSEAELRLF